MAQPNLPEFDYYLDESDPDVLVLRRQDGSFVSAFSARGATKEGVVEAAREDYSALLEEHSGSLGLLRGVGQTRKRLTVTIPTPSRRLRGRCSQLMKFYGLCIAVRAATIISGENPY